MYDYEDYIHFVSKLTHANEMYLNKNTGEMGEHEIHKGNCTFLPDPENREYLGENITFTQATRIAHAKGYKKVDGCYYCNRQNHVI